MKQLIYISWLMLGLVSCNDNGSSSEENKPTDEPAQVEQKEKPASIEEKKETGGPCAYEDVQGKLNTLAYYEQAGIVQARFSAAESTFNNLFESERAQDTVLFYAKGGDGVNKGSGIRAIMTLLTEGSCDPYTPFFKTSDGSKRSLVHFDSLNHSGTDLKDEYK